jgi:ribosomal protein S18 acetylase RimI-like enzyme
MNELLDNVMWYTLTGHHARHSAGTHDARRYAKGFSPILGFPDPENPNFSALLPYCQPNEHFYIDGWSGKAPHGWQIEAESKMFRMVWSGDIPAHDEAIDASPLGPQHVAQALALAQLTRPGPFGPRTIELGSYFGFFVGESLVAMAGERMHAGNFREVSAVCTHPDFQGRGIARKLMLKLIRREMEHGETPFLHVMQENHGARALYQRMGFRDYVETVVRVISPAQEHIEAQRGDA